MPPIWSNPSLTRFANQAEVIYSTEYPCIIDRVALSIVSGTSQYTLGDEVLSIRRVTWKGRKVYPMGLLGLRNTGMSGTQGGRPLEYIFNNVGKQVIQLFPVPQETIAAITTNLYGTEIINRVIVDYYRVANNSSFILPSYFRRQLIKSYVLYRAYLKEGKGQNLKAAKYHKMKWEALMVRYGEVMFDLTNKPRRLIQSDYEDKYLRTPMAHLPIDKFGISVSDEDF